MEIYRAQSVPGAPLDPSRRRRLMPIATAKVRVGCTAASTAVTCATTGWPKGIERCDVVR